LRTLRAELSRRRQLASRAGEFWIHVGQKVTSLDSALDRQVRSALAVPLN
jgi:hypothetical protein